jgi:hypothetical protein
MYLVNNGFDFFIETIFPSRIEFRSFVEELKAGFDISRIQVFEVVADKRREDFNLF